MTIPVQLTRRALLQSTMVGAAAVAIESCGGSTRTSSSSATTGGTPKRGGRLVIMQASDTTSLDTQALAHGEDINAKRLLYSPLVDFKPDFSGVGPGLARAWDVEDDATTYTFHLRPAKFSDGSPITAADVKFSILYSKQGAVYGPFLSAIKSVSTPDDQTVVVKLAQRDNFFLPGAALVYVVPDKFGGRTAKQFFRKPVASGPFKLVEWQPGRSLSVARNPGYWQPNRPYLDELEIQVAEDGNQRLLSYQSGTAQMYAGLSYQQASGIDKSELHQLDPTARVVLLVLNDGIAPFDDLKVRTAAGLAIDRQQLASSVYRGQARAADAVIPPGIPGLTGDPRWKTDASAAAAALSGSGHPGADFTLLGPTLNGVDPIVSQFVLDNLNRVGFKAKLETPDFATAIASWQANKMQALLLDNGMYLPTVGEPLIIYQTFVAAFSHWPAMRRLNAIVDRARSASSDAEVLRTGQDFETYVADTQAVIPMATPLLLYAIKPSVRGFQATPSGTLFAEQLWVSQ